MANGKLIVILQHQVTMTTQPQCYIRVKLQVHIVKVSTLSMSDFKDLLKSVSSQTDVFILGSCLALGWVILTNVIYNLYMSLDGHHSNITAYLAGQ